jgi:glucan biosynthesis protein
VVVVVEVASAIVRKHHMTDGWRLFFDLLPNQGESAERRCRLSQGGTMLSEVCWSGRDGQDS